MPDELDREKLEIERDEALYRQYCEALLNDFRDDFERGEKFALLACLIFCDRSQLSLPHWALHELALASLRYTSRSSEDFHNAIFGAQNKPVGRYAHRGTKRKKEREHQVWFDIVWALKQQGHKGEELYNQARAEISRGHVIHADGEFCLAACASPNVPEPETLRKTIQRMQKAGARPKFAFMFMPCGSLLTTPASE